MKITQFTDYSLRLLLYLARNPDRVVTVREIAEYYGISAEHLKKVVRRLVELAHIGTVRGKNGGLKLARAPKDINVGTMVRECENLELMPCGEPGAPCPIADCRLASMVDKGLRAFLAELDSHTLADLI